MKAERRHELQHNELDDFLVKATKFLRENGLMLGIGVGVVILAGVVYWGLFAERPINESAGLWQKYIIALADRDARHELEKFIDDQDRAGKTSDPAVLWAQLSVGNFKLAEADKDLFEDRQSAREALEEAEKHFKAVEKGATRNPELRDRARIGLARVYESQFKAKEAQEQYALVSKSSPDTPLGKLAARGERRLAQKANQEFLAWFAEQKPEKPKPPSTMNPKPPSDFPDFSVPGLDDESEKPITPGLKIPSRRPSGSDTERSQAPKPSPTSLRRTNSKKPDDSAEPEPQEKQPE